MLADVHADSPGLPAGLRDTSGSGPDLCPSSAVLAQVTRAGLLESVHLGSVVVTDPDGSIAWAAGSASRRVFSRSANKPMQTLAMVRAGLPLDGELLALACGSHSGEPFHVDGVRAILASAGVDECALANPREYPGDVRARKYWIRDRKRRSSVTMRCSGKHAAMILTCARNGWSIPDYLDPQHILQKAITEEIAECCNEPAPTVATDGCGAPTHAVGLAGLALAFGRLTSAPEGSDERRIADACRAHPEYVSGSLRQSARLMRAVPGLLCKSGAEGVYAAGLPDGRGVAIKIDDGAPRARGVALAATLQAMGVHGEEIAAQCLRPIRSGNIQVGEVSPGAVFGSYR
ncbi:MAG TPA: asparaginase [Pseudonocardia sp.]|nr:asparaginase [Pseudonocardia sp.]